jgi:hypothetical protein
MIKHEHLWLLLLGHTVLVVMPAVLLVIVARWFFKFLVWFARCSPVRVTTSTASEAYALPPCLMGFIMGF